VNALAAIGVLAQQDSTTFEAPNTWLPEGSEILWGTIAFVIIVALLWKFAAPPIRASLKARTARIDEDIKSAAQARADAEAEAVRCRAGLTDLDSERERILREGTETAERVRIEGIARNDREVVEAHARAETDIEASRGRATTDVQTQVATLAADATERIVTAQLDDATLEQLIESYIAEVGASQ
jgi:F-type H+-transporting ATPase subunit b